MTDIDSYILTKDITCWYDSIGEDYQDYYNPIFGIRIKIEYEDTDFLISVFRGNSIVVAVYTEELYTIKLDNEIVSHILKMVWEIINE